MPTDIQITTEILYRGALFFALVDAVYVPLLMRRVQEERFRRLKGSLVISASLIWFGIWSWAIGNYWDSVYAYVFSAWAQRWVPWIAFVVAGVVALGVWQLALRFKRNIVLWYCGFGGALGSLTHVWAVQRGIVSKPPMLQGASPVAAVILAFFEYMFYWCTILVMASILNSGMEKLRDGAKRSGRDGQLRRS